MLFKEIKVLRRKYNEYQMHPEDTKQDFLLVLIGIFFYELSYFWLDSISLSVQADFAKKLFNHRDTDL